jgi:hypothetical protein
MPPYNKEYLPSYNIYCQIYPKSSSVERIVVILNLVCIFRYENDVVDETQGVRGYLFKRRIDYEKLAR